MYRNYLMYVLLLGVCWGCAGGSATEKHHKAWNKVIPVQEKIKEIKVKDVLIGGNVQLHLLGDYLIIGDWESFDKLVYVFDKNNFTYLASTAPKGKGPGEITLMGYIGVNEADREFYVADNAKYKIFSYPLDSVLNNPLYMPEVKMEMQHEIIPGSYQYVNDTLCFGEIIQGLGVNDFRPYTGRWNMKTGEIKLMKYEHPDVKKKRMDVAVSVENGLYAECYSRYDLMIIGRLNGELKCNVYGPDWSTEINGNNHYTQAAFCGDKILAAYSGGHHASDAYYPTKFIAFDLDGNYLATLETGYKILFFCYDKGKNRIIMSLDDEMQLAYLDLDGLLGETIHK